MNCEYESLQANPTHWNADSLTSSDLLDSVSSCCNTVLLVAVAVVFILKVIVRYVLRLTPMRVRLVCRWVAEITQQKFSHSQKQIFQNASFWHRFDYLFHFWIYGYVHVCSWELSNKPCPLLDTMAISCPTSTMAVPEVHGCCDYTVRV